jgi:membrane associated rhomboid family serine protease
MRGNGSDIAGVISRADEKQIAKTEEVRAHSPISATHILIAINCVVFTIISVIIARTDGTAGLFTHTLTPDSFAQFGANYGPNTLGGQYWRLITSLFVHADIWHLLINMSLLWLATAALAKRLRHYQIFAIYFLTGISGSVLSLIVHPTLAGVGASGAVAGFAGVMLSFFGFGRLDMQRRRVIGLLIGAGGYLAICFLSGSQSQAVDNAAHLGGCLSGLIIGGGLAWASRATSAERAGRQMRVLISYSITVAILFAALVNARADVVELYKGERDLERAGPEAIAHIQAYISKNPNDVAGYYTLAYAYEHLGRCDLAADSYWHVLKIEPNDAASQYHIARIYTYCMNRPAEAVELFRRSLPHLRLTADKCFYFGAALDSTGNLQEAEKVARKGVALDPRSTRNHHLLATVLRQLGKAEESLAEQKIEDRLIQSEKH